MLSWIRQAGIHQDKLRCRPPAGGVHCGGEGGCVRAVNSVRPKRGGTDMTEITYDPQADAVYIYLGSGKIDVQEEAGPFIYDVDADGRVIGIEILSESKVLAPGDWQKAKRPGEKRIDAAE